MENFTLCWRSTRAFENLQSGYYFETWWSVDSLVDSAVEYLHKRNIAHRDIKPENLLINAQFKLKLCDFGSCSNLHKIGDDDISTPMEAVGSPEYNAPEIIAGESCKTSQSLRAADVFSLGCVLFVLVVSILKQVLNMPPFRTASSSDPYYSRLTASNTSTYWKTFSKSSQELSPEFKDLFESMTRRYPEDRIRLEDVKLHPWFSKHTDSKDTFQKALLERIHQVQACFKQQAYKTLGALNQKNPGEHSSLDSGASDKGPSEVSEHLNKLMQDYKQKSKKLRLELSNPTAITSSQSSSKSSKSQEEDHGVGDLSPSELPSGKKMKGAPVTAGPLQGTKSFSKGLQSVSHSLSRQEGYWSSSSSDNDETSNPN